MTHGLTTWRCTSCGEVHFPRRATCPRCHGDDFHAQTSTTAVVESVTHLRRRGIRVATLGIPGGPRVIGRLEEDVPVGSAVRLAQVPGRSGHAYVPTGSGSPLPSHPSLLRDLPLTECTVPALLQRQASQHPDKVLLRCGETRWSYAQVVERAGRAASAMEGRGIRPGDRVAVLCGNRVELLETVLGCAWLGAVVVPLNTALRGAGLLHTLTDSGARALLVEPALAPVLDDLPLPDCLQEVWLLDEEEPERVSQSSRGASQVRLLPYPRSEVTREPHQAAPGDTLAILYTSGTTGLPKGVLCPHAQFYWWGISVGECLELGPDDVLFTTLPLFHTNALNAFFQAAVAGSTFVLERRFSASRFWSQATECGATVTYLLGAMVQILLTRPRLDSDRQHRVRAALSPATPVHASVEFEERFGVTLVEGYGSTETNLVLAASLSHQRPGLMGVPLADFEARVVDAGGLDVPDGTPGELICRSRRPYAFATGYHCNPQATAESWKDLWFHTGDQVIRHEDGWYQFVDRIKDSIRRRGENISSLEVELVVGGHPAVEAVAVYAVPSELAEDEVMAAITVRPDVSLDPQDLVTWCEPRLAYFAIPRFVEILDQLPLTENGKIRKAALRERGVTPSTWDRESLSPRRARSSH